MSGPPLLIASQGQAASPAIYVIPGTQEIRLSSVHATFDGSAAGGAFLPCLSIYAQSGELLSRTFPGTGTIAAGASGEVSYFPFPPTSTGSIPASAARGFYSFVNTVDQAVADNTAVNLDFPTERANVGPGDCPVTYHAPGINAFINIGPGVGTTFGVWLVGVDVELTWAAPVTVQGELRLRPGSPAYGTTAWQPFYRTSISTLFLQATTFVYFTGTIGPGVSAQILQNSGSAATSKATTGVAGPPVTYGVGMTMWGVRVY